MFHILFTIRFLFKFSQSRCKIILYDWGNFNNHSLLEDTEKNKLELSPSIKPK